MTSCPEEMVLRIWGFWKSVSWEIEIRPSRQNIEFSAIELIVRDSAIESKSWPWSRVVGSLPQWQRIEFSTIESKLSFSDLDTFIAPNSILWRSIHMNATASTKRKMPSEAYKIFDLFSIYFPVIVSGQMFIG